MKDIRVSLRPSPIFSRADIISVEVPTETGKVCVMDIEHRWDQDSYRLEFSGTLLDQSPEGITAAIQVGLLALKAARIPNARSGLTLG